MSGDRKHLEWIYDRLIHVHGESPSVDYMLRFRRIIDGSSTPTIRAALERLVELDNSSIRQDGQWAFKHENAIADALEALAAVPVGEGPSEESITEMTEDLEWRRLPQAKGTGNSFLLDLALAVLARWRGSPAAPPEPHGGPPVRPEPHGGQLFVNNKPQFPPPREIIEDF